VTTLYELAVLGAPSDTQLETVMKLLDYYASSAWENGLASVLAHRRR
jgi:hypothetical protein